MKNAKEALKSDRVETFKQATDQLTNASHTLAQKMYEAASKQKTQAPAGDPSSRSETGGKDAGAKDKSTVVDADYEVVDGDEDDKKKK